MKITNISALASVWDEFGMEQLVKVKWEEFLHDHLQKSAKRIEKDASDPIAKIIDQYKKWLRLLQQIGNGLLPVHSQKGLIGELLYLSDLIDKYNEDVITYARDFQIINGGQTTASLSNARHKDAADLGQIYVQMKLTEVDNNADKSSELIRNISRSSNSQNKVSDADFFATHPFHIRMEQISRRIFAPASGGAQYETKWFYERARGQYLQAQMRMTKAQKDKFTAQNPKKQVITKTDLAKYHNSWSGMPQVVSKGAQTNFMKFAEVIDEAWNKSDTSFNDKFFKDTVSLAILFKHTEWVVSHQPWFEQGYRANIVTYSIALLHRLLKAQYPDTVLDLQLIWSRQEVPDVITNELVAQELMHDPIFLAGKLEVSLDKQLESLYRIARNYITTADWRRLKSA